MLFKICLNKKFILLICIIIFSTSNLYSFENKIRYKIDNEIITNIDILNEIQYLKALNPNFKTLDDERKNLIGKNSLIREKIKKNEILKYLDEVILEEQYLEKLIKDRYTKLNITSRKQFLEYLKSYQVNIDEVERKFAIEALWNQIIFQKFSSQIKIDKEKIKKKIIESSKNKTKSYLLSEIVFNILNKNDLDNKYNEIKNIILKDGFENAALTYSISDSAKLGGKLGWIREESLNKMIKKELSNLKKDNFTKPILMASGYLILKIEDINLIEKKYNKEMEFKKVVDFETNQQLNQFSNIYFNKIKKDITINEF